MGNVLSLLREINNKMFVPILSRGSIGADRRIKCHPPMSEAVGRIAKRARESTGRVWTVGFALVAAFGLLSVPGVGEEPAPVSLLTALLPAAEGHRTVAAVVEFPAAALPQKGDSSDLDGQVRLRVTDAKGGEVVSLADPFLVPVVESDGQPLAGIKLFAEVDLGPGDYEIEATLLGTDGKSRGSATTRLRIAAAAGETWVASPPLLADRRPNWRAFRSNNLQASGVVFPFTSPEGGVFLPRGVPTLAAGQPLDMLALVASPHGDFPELVAEARSVDGNRRIELPVSVLGVTSGAIAGVSVVNLRIGPLSAAGEYRIRLGFADSEGTLESPFLDGVPVRLETPASTGAASAAAEEEEENPSAPLPATEAALTDGYLKVLRAASGENLKAAGQELAEFERTATQRGAGSVSDLRGAEKRLARKVAGRDEAAWRAILGIHLAADDIYVHWRNAWLTAQGRRFMQELVRFGGFRRDPRSKAFAADVLALTSPREALDIDPNHSLALLRTAIGEERAFRFKGSVEFLRRLLAHDPGNVQARLRLGMDLSQLGDRDDAQRELSSVEKATAPAWMHELAIGEQATLAHDAGHRKEAEEILRRAIEQNGGQQLYIQLAFYLDQWNRSHEAVSLLNRMRVEEGQERASARHIYAQDPEAEITAVRDQVDALAKAGLAELGRAAAAIALPKGAG